MATPVCRAYYIIHRTCFLIGSNLWRRKKFIVQILFFFVNKTIFFLEIMK